MSARPHSTVVIPPRPQAHPDERKLITIASGKGGVGKTWLAITLTHALARNGKTVLLFDGDLGLANVDVQLGIAPQHDLTDVLTGNAPVSAALTRYEDQGARACGFDVLAGSSGTGSLASLGRDAIIALRQRLIDAAKNYDHVVLDLGAGLDQSVTTLARHAGTCLIVATPEPTAITDAYAFIKLRRQRDTAGQLKIVVNNAASRREGEQTYETLAKACQAFLKFTPTLAGIIRRDDKVRSAIRAQTPLLTRHGDADAAQDVCTIARALAG